MREYIVRSHERTDYGRCPKKWFWAWRRGLVPRARTFGALSLGTWWHAGLAGWYALPYIERRVTDSFTALVNQAAIYDITIATLDSAPDYEIEKAEELSMLGESMAREYERHYQGDPEIHVISAELPLEFSLDKGVTHRLKPDLIYRDRYAYVWLMEHKTATSIRTGHLVLDGQARPYGAMAEHALRKIGAMQKDETFKGIMYNFARKALSDERPIDAAGKSLNKNGTVSARQPAPLFKRHPVMLSRKAKIQTLNRIRVETRVLTDLTQEIRLKKIDPATIPKTPHSSCEKFCQFFTMCVAEEEGTDIRSMEEIMYIRRNPYEYDEDTSDDRATFEMG